MTVIICRAGHEASIDDEGRAADCPCIVALRAEVQRLKVANTKLHNESTNVMAECDALKDELAAAKAWRPEGWPADYESQQERASRVPGLTMALEEAQHALAAEKAALMAVAERVVMECAFIVRHPGGPEGEDGYNLDDLAQRMEHLDIAAIVKEKP